VNVEWPGPNRKLGWVDYVGLAGLVGLLVARFIPVARLPFWGCTLRQATGIPCPGCGLTRVADRMSHFNFAGAWDANPLGTVAAFAFMLAIVATVLHLAFKLPLPNVDPSPRDWRILRAVLIAALVVNYAFMVVKAKFPELL
jgi:hypothetical protein